MQLVFTIGIFIVVAVIVFFISESMEQRAQSGGLRSRLGNITGGYTPEQLSAAGGFAPGQPVTPIQTSGMDRPDMLPTVSEYLRSNNLSQALRIKLHQAGLRLRPAEFIALCASGIVGLASVALFLNARIWLVGAMGVIGGLIPVLILEYRQSKRTMEFDKQLPDALTLIASSLRTGYSFLHSCDMVIGEMKPPIAQEFSWVQGEVRLGVPMEQALQRMVTRIRSYDFDLVVTAVSIQLQVGGNLAEILDTIANTIRERVRIKGEIDGLTAEGKLSGVILFAMPIFMALFLNLKNPDYFTPLLKDPIGIPMLWGTFISMCIGGLVIKKMVNIDI
jgi:tight adherence protein B